jgi:hypothetical protein
MNLEKVSFKKTDIEGAEKFALYGAKNTIQRFKLSLLFPFITIWRTL